VLKSLATRKGRIRPLAFSPDGRLALMGKGRIMLLWDIDKERDLSEFVGHTGRIRGAGFCRDGKRIFSGGTDGTVRFWSLAEEREVDRIAAHERSVECVIPLRDGRRVLTAGFGRARESSRGPWLPSEVRLWDLYPSPWPFILAVSLTIAFAIFLITMKLRARRRSAEG